MVMNPSQQVRKDILSQRDLLTDQQIRARSQVIARTLLERAEIINAETIFTYVNFRSEVRTSDIIDVLLDQGKQVAVPITRVRDRRLDIIRITNPDSDLIPGYYGIPEPKEELVEHHRISPTLIDTIILPGSVFDMRCGRFGYGGGFYDRLLAQIPAAKRIAIAFDLQVVDKLTLEEHDEILDCVITERQTISNPYRYR